jgi:hypothetical protein
MLRLVVVLVATAVGSVASAQTLPDTLVWERVGTLNDVRGLFFDGDALYAAPVGDPIQVFRPGDTDWSQAFPVNARAIDLLITPERMVCLLDSPSGVGCSIDSLQTRYGTQDDAFTLPVHTPEGALLLGTRGSPSEGGRLAARSTDGGATWTPHGLGDGTDGLGTTNLVVIPPSDELPGGRIVATGYGGIATSDDDGRTWQPTALYGGLAYAAWSSARIEHGPYVGRLLAVVERGAPGGEPTGLYASTDGTAWERIGDTPGGAVYGLRLTAAPDGTIYAYHTTNEEYSVFRTVDGGETWENLGPVWVEWPAEAREITVGPDGRLYAACSGGGFAGYDGGVFRTTEPVVTVASEPEASGSLKTELEVYPNPMTGRATVTLALTAPAEVRAAVFDVLGREVAVLHDGLLAAGTHRLAFDGARLPAGVYLVRVESGSDRLTERITLLR